MSPNLDSSDADDGLRHLLDGRGEEERDRQPHGPVERHRHEHTAGRDHVAQQHVDGEGHENDDLARNEKRGQIHPSQVGTSENLGDFLPGKEEDVGLKGERVHAPTNPGAFCTRPPSKEGTCFQENCRSTVPSMQLAPHSLPTQRRPRSHFNIWGLSGWV